MDVDYRGMLLLDVDGPLNPYAGTNKPRLRAGYRKHRLWPRGWDGAEALSVWLHTGHGPRLVELAAECGLELVWCTTWLGEANRLIAPRIGLPGTRLPVIEFEPGGDGWKYDAVLAYADGCPVAWLDDDFQLYPDALARFETARGDVPTLLRHVDPEIGLVPGDFEAVREWAARL